VEDQIEIHMMAMSEDVEERQKAVNMLKTTLLVLKIKIKHGTI